MIADDCRPPSRLWGWTALGLGGYHGVMEDVEVAVRPRVATSQGTAAGVYVHIPFCKTKCSYCDFNCYAGQNVLIPPYVEALCQELSSYGQAGWKARTLYFGGGTPSLLRPEQVRAVVDTARDALDLADAEVTLEANPGTVDKSYFAALLQAGVNRLSLGMQSFRDSDLKRLARHHTARDARDAFQAAREAGFPSISLDLIYGLPDQTLTTWSENVRQALALHPEHVSLYGLTIEEGTPLSRQVSRGVVRPPEDELMADMYECAHELMSQAGLRRYEISNWALPGHESQHNLVYWHNQPYIGAGAGAHGYLASYRYCNELLPQRYITRVETGGVSEVEAEFIDADLERAETVMLALRLDEGLDIRRYRECFHEELPSRFRQVFDEGARYGLLEGHENIVTLTDRGRLLSNEVFSRLLPEPTLA